MALIKFPIVKNYDHLKLGTILNVYVASNLVQLVISFWEKEYCQSLATQLNNLNNFIFKNYEHIPVSERIKG